MNEFRVEIKELVLSEASLKTKMNVLRSLKDAGATQESVRLSLEELREEMNFKEDHILELLDFVCGFCSVEMRIWPDV